MRSTTEAATVIFIDDNRDLAEAVADLLAAMGHRAIARYTGFHEFTGGAIFRGAPDLLILDLNLIPDLTGEQMGRNMRAAGYTGPIIAMSGDYRRLEEARSVGLFVSVIKKPFEYREFERTVRHALSRGSFLHNPTDHADGE